MKNIHMIHYHEIKKNGKWILDTDEIDEVCFIDFETYWKITSPQTVAFFKSLSGKEKLTYENGKVVKLVSTSPDRTKRATYRFLHLV